MTTIVSGSSITFNDNTTQNTSAYGGGFAFRNRIINGAMMIDQRNAGASVTPASGGFITDRFVYFAAQASKVTAQQSTTAPTGFVNSLLVTSSSAYTVGASENFTIGHLIEGLNVSDLAWGTASAATVTLSFWVRSSLTGTFGGSILNSAANRSYPFTFTISAANTWEQKSITIAGDTSGTWLTTNGVGIRLYFNLGAGASVSGTAGAWSGSTFYSATGATSVVGTNGATFYITGVQLEKGSTATSFDYRPYSAELAMCQRYCYVLGGGALYERIADGGWWNSTTLAFPNISLPVTMRSASGMAVSYSSLSHFNVASGQTGLNPTAIALDSAPNGNLLCLSVNVASGATTGAVANLYAFNSLSARLYVTCEL